MKEKHYIYAIYHVSKKKYYVGETSNYINRIKDHMTYGERGYKNFNTTFESRGLYLAMNKYGITDFLFKVVEICEKEKRIAREMYWIRKYNSNKENGYNTLFGIDGDKLDYLLSEDIDEKDVLKNARKLCEQNNIKFEIPDYYIDFDLILHEKKIKKTTPDKENATNIVALKEKSTGKIYVCSSTSYTKRHVLNRVFGGANLKKTSSIYIYTRDKEKGDFDVIFLKNQVEERKSRDYFYLVTLLQQHGFKLDDLLFENQRIRCEKCGLL